MCKRESVVPTKWSPADMKAHFAGMSPPPTEGAIKSTECLMTGADKGRHLSDCRRSSFKWHI